MTADADAPGKTVARYGLWQSPLAADKALAQPAAPMAPFIHNGALHFLQALAEDDGRVALLRKAPDGPDAAVECLTPPPFNIRTRAHEYGGRCFCILGEHIIFNNLADGRIYRQDLSAAAAPQAVTEAAGRAMHFADLTPLPRLQAVIAVMEVFDGGDGAGAAEHSRDALVLVDLAGEAASRGAARPLVLVEGGDFYAAPVVSPDQSQLAWLEWDRPFMPWDQSRLVKARLPGAPRKIAAADREVVAAALDQAVCQPGFLDDHNLLFAADRDARPAADGGRRAIEFWDFFRHIDHRGDDGDDGGGDDDGGHSHGEIRRVTADRYEYGEAHWVFGASRWQRLSENTIAAVATTADGDRLLEVMLDSGDTAPLAEGAAVCGDLAAAGDALLWVARHAERGAEIHKLDLKSGEREVLHRAARADADDAPAAFSRAQPLIYPTRDGAEAHAIFYPPANPDYRAPGDALPPLLVMVHGGPTARASAELHPLKQYFASLGYAILDVNHRGSTGYGRAYRQALLGRWGEVDADDIADGVKFLADEGRIDPGLVFIRGGSAGGYAVLRALTRFPHLFSAGACYYGIGNLITLAQITHRFEADYTDRLIGETFDPAVAAAVEGGAGPAAPASRFVQRSPLFQVERIACPLILFQGLEDKIVPPAVSREVAAALKAKGLAHEYIEYENEGHGFRKLATRVDSLEKETAFFARVIREKAGDGDPGDGDGDGDGSGDGGGDRGDGDGVESS